MSRKTPVAIDAIVVVVVVIVVCVPISVAPYTKEYTNTRSRGGGNLNYGDFG